MDEVGETASLSTIIPIRHRPSDRFTFDFADETREVYSVARNKLTRQIIHFYLEIDEDMELIYDTTEPLRDPERFVELQESLGDSIRENGQHIWDNTYFSKPSDFEYDLDGNSPVDVGSEMTTIDGNDIDDDNVRPKIDGSKFTDVRVFNWLESFSDNHSTNIAEHAYAGGRAPRAHAITGGTLWYNVTSTVDIYQSINFEEPGTDTLMVPLGEYIISLDNDTSTVDAKEEIDQDTFNILYTNESLGLLSVELAGQLPFPIAPKTFLQFQHLDIIEFVDQNTENYYFSDVTVGVDEPNQIDAAEEEIQQSTSDNIEVINRNGSLGFLSVSIPENMPSSDQTSLTSQVKSLDGVEFCEQTDTDDLIEAEYSPDFDRVFLEADTELDLSLRHLGGTAGYHVELFMESEDGIQLHQNRDPKQDSNQHDIITSIVGHDESDSELLKTNPWATRGLSLEEYYEEHGEYENDVKRIRHQISDRAVDFINNRDGSRVNIDKQISGMSEIYRVVNADPDRDAGEITEDELYNKDWYAVVRLVASATGLGTESLPYLGAIGVSSFTDGSNYPENEDDTKYEGNPNLPDWMGEHRVGHETPSGMKVEEITVGLSDAN